MSFTELMTSYRGPGVLGTVMALFVLLGFTFLFLFVFDESYQGGGNSIELLISRQGKQIESYKSDKIHYAGVLEKGWSRVADEKKLARLKRESRFSNDRIAGLKSAVEKLSSEIDVSREIFGIYKERYRKSVRSMAKGEMLASLTTTAGVVYKEVNIRDVTPVGIQIRHEGGFKRIPFEVLPAAMIERFQFDMKQKLDALAAETTAERELEVAVAITDRMLDEQAGQRRRAETEALRERSMRAINAKQARIGQLGNEIRALDDAILREARKTLSRAGVMRGEIANKRKAIAELQSQIAVLRENL